MRTLHMANPTPVKYRPYLYQATADAAWDAEAGRWNVTGKKVNADGTIDETSVTLPVIAPPGLAYILKGEVLRIAIAGGGGRGFARMNRPRLPHEMYWEDGKLKIHTPAVMFLTNGAATYADDFSPIEINPGATPETGNVWVTFSPLATWTGVISPTAPSIGEGEYRYSIGRVFFTAEYDLFYIQQEHLGLKTLDFPHAEKAYSDGLVFVLPIDGAAFGTTGWRKAGIAQITVVTGVNFSTETTETETIKYLKVVE